MKAAIIDGYVDEPSCLGVPPYISPYPRYIYGMLRTLGFRVSYITIDYLRQNFDMRRKLEDFDLAVIIAGIAVPGKYIGGNPLSKRELFSMDVAERNILVGPITLELSKKERKMLLDSNIEVIEFPFERELFNTLCNTNLRFDLDKFSVVGAEVVKQHPDFPNVLRKGFLPPTPICGWSKASSDRPVCSWRTHFQRGAMCSI